MRREAAPATNPGARVVVAFGPCLAIVDHCGAAARWEVSPETTSQPKDRIPVEVTGAVRRSSDDHVPQVAVPSGSHELIIEVVDRRFAYLLKGDRHRLDLSLLDPLDQLDRWNIGSVMATGSLRRIAHVPGQDVR